MGILLDELIGSALAAYVLAVYRHHYLFHVRPVEEGPGLLNRAEECKPSDTVLVHSSMKSIGKVEGGADTVLDVLMDYFGKTGLLVFPTLTYTIYGEEKKIYSPEKTPSVVGLLPEMFRKMVEDAAGDARVLLRQVEFRTQGRDHPILPAARETEYLKCGLFRVL